MTKRIFYGWWIVGACFFIALYVGSAIFFGFTAFFDPIREEFGWSYTQVSFAVSLRGLEMGIFAPFIGLFVDRFGPRRMIFYGVIMVGVGLILLSITKSLAMFYGSIVLLAFGAGGCTALVLMVTVANWFYKRVGLALGVMSSGFGASGLIVPVIVWLIDAYGWRTASIILGLAMWALGIPLCFIIRDRPEHYGQLPDGEVSNGAMPCHEAKDGEETVGLRKMMVNSSFLYLNITELIRWIASVGVIVHIMPYLSSIGMPRFTAGLVAGGIPLLSNLGRFGFGWLADMYDKRRVMAVTYFLMGMGVLALCSVHRGWITLPFLLLFSSGLGGSMVLRGAIVREYFQRASFSKLLGIIMGSAAIGGIIGPTFAGWVFDAMGTYRVTWLIFSCLLGFITYLILRIRPI
jgi:MFS family permease